MASIEDLKRQRALLAQHLEWLDREIAASEGKPDAAERKKTGIVSSAASLPEIPQGFANDKSELQSAVKKGCLMGFVGLLLFLGVACVAIYWFFYR